MKKLIATLAFVSAAAVLNAAEYSFSPFGWLTELDIYGVPERSQGIRWNNLRFSPYVEVLLGYDSNPPLAHNWDGGSWDITATASATLTYISPTERTLASGNLFYSIDRYFQRAKNDRDTWGFNLSMHHETPKGYYFTFAPGYTHAASDDYYNGETADRDTLNLSISAGRDSILSRNVYGATVSYQKTDYESDAYNDNDALGISAFIGRNITPKTALTLSGSYYHRSSDNTDDLDNYSLRLGLRSRLQAKVWYTMEGGVAYSETSDWHKWSPSYKVSFGWKISPKLSTSVYGSTWVQPSETSNRGGSYNYASMYYTIGAGVTYTPVRRLSTTTQVLYRRNEYEYMGDYGTSYLSGTADDLYMARIAATFALTPYMSFVASASYQNQQSTRKLNEYDEYSVALGVRLRY